MFLKRTTIAAILLLAPQSAGASDRLFETARDLLTAYGEASGYMESCRPDLDRTALRRAAVVDDFDFEDMFSEIRLKMLSIAYEVRRSQGMTTECSEDTGMALKERVETAMDDLQRAMDRALVAQRNKAE
jgi:hypothetical protein